MVVIIVMYNHANFRAVVTKLSGTVIFPNKKKGANGKQTKCVVPYLKTGMTLQWTEWIIGRLFIRPSVQQRIVSAAPNYTCTCRTRTHSATDIARGTKQNASPNRVGRRCSNPHTFHKKGTILVISRAKKTLTVVTAPQFFERGLQNFLIRDWAWFTQPFSPLSFSIIRGSFSALWVSTWFTQPSCPLSFSMIHSTFLPFFGAYVQERIFPKIEFTFHVCFTNHIWHLVNVKCGSHFTFPTSQITLHTKRYKE